jgi:hypothetical protein
MWWFQQYILKICEFSESMVLYHDLEWDYMEHFSLKSILGYGCRRVWNVMNIAVLVHNAEVPVGLLIRS